MSESDLPRRIVLARHVSGVPSPEDFRVETFARAPLEDGWFRARTLWLSADPGTRSRLSGAASYAGALKLGDVVDGFAVAEVVESRHPDWPVGARLTVGSGWTSECVSNGRGYCARLPDLGVPLEAWIGVLGVPGMTAWFGLKRVGRLREGDRVLVTSAAGPVGATAGQLARAWGASRVVGVASGADKAAWLTDTAGFDAVIDHQAPDFDAQLAAAMPEGIDLLFDNVGNAMIDRVLPMMRPRGRIVVSGQVADYNVPAAQRHGIRNTDRFITHRLSMEGLVVFDDLKAFPDAQAEAAALLRDGRLRTKIVVGEGLDSLPSLFCGLFASGAEFGRRLARLRTGEGDGA